MKLLAVRMVGLGVLVGLYLYQPVLGVVALAAGFAYLGLKRIQMQPTRQISLLN